MIFKVSSNSDQSMILYMGKQIYIKNSPTGAGSQGKSGPPIPSKTPAKYSSYTFSVLTCSLFNQSLNIQQKDGQSSMQQVQPRPMMCGKLWMNSSDS